MDMPNTLSPILTYEEEPVLNIVVVKIHMEYPPLNIYDCALY